MSFSPFAVPTKQKMNFLLLALTLLSVSSAVSSSTNTIENHVHCQLTIDRNLVQMIDFHNVARSDSNTSGFVIQWIAHTDEFQTMPRNAMQPTQTNETRSGIQFLYHKNLYQGFRSNSALGARRPHLIFRIQNNLPISEMKSLSKAKNRKTKAIPNTTE